MKYSGIGGQAVIEGIMMRNHDHYAVAVRKPDGGIAVDVRESIPYAERFKLAGIPFIRGSFSFVESMVIGMKTLTYSASFFEDDGEEEPGRIEARLDLTREALDTVEKGMVLGFMTSVIQTFFMESDTYRKYPKKGLDFIFKIMTTLIRRNLLTNHPSFSTWEILFCWFHLPVSPVPLLFLLL